MTPPSPIPPPPGTPAGEMPLELQELAADFAIEGELGRGGSAVVYRARERALDRVVAIKVIRAPYVGDDELVARLEREARLVARLDHPNVIGLLGVRRLRHGSLALVMRYVHGHTLRAELRRRGALPLARADAVLRDVGLALSAAHAHGIVHRDVKPENIHIEHGVQRALLADFGAATPLRGDLRLTVAGMAIGTPGYMAPELIDGGDATPASDVYALGLVAWEMLAGRAPWEGDSLFAVLSYRKESRLPALDALRDDIPPSVAAAVAGALHPDPAQRWSDVQRFVEEFARPSPRRWLTGGGAGRRGPLFGGSATPGATPGAGGGAIGTPLRDQPTVRFARPANDGRAEAPPPEASVAPSPGPTARAGDGRRAASPAAPATPHPSAAVFAADDEPDFEFEPDHRSPPSRWRGPLTIVAAVILMAGALATARYASLAHRPTTTVAEAGGDVPASFTLPVIPPTGAPTDSVGPGAASDAARAGTTAPGVPAPAATASADSAAPAPALGPATSGTEDAGADGRGAPTAVGGRGEGEALRPTRPAPSPSAPPPPATVAPAGPTAPPGRAAPSSTAPAATAAATAAATPAQTQLPPAPTAPAAVPAAVPPASPSVVATPSAPPAAGAAVRSGAATLALGGLHSCAILADGHLRCWGANDRGQLGSLPAGASFTEVAAGVTHSCARATDGRTLCWGANEHGQLGDGTHSAHPDPRPVLLSGDQSALALGAAHSCALIRGGSVECWGANDAGQLGTGDQRERSTPSAVAGPGNVRYTALASGWRHSCALTADGTAYCWGDNSAGQLGDGTTESRDAPTLVNSSLRFRALAAGRAHSCGVSTTGELYCWGQNDAGQLGTGSRRNASTPRPVALAGSVRHIVAGSMHSCVLTTDGAVSCWGQNRYGQIGDGTTIDRDTPVRVNGTPRLVALEASGAHSCGRTSGGAIYCWGYNVYGQLGDGTRQNRLRPVAVTLRP